MDRQDQAHRVAKLLEFAAPAIDRSASLRCNNAAELLGKQRQQLALEKLLAKHTRPVAACPMELKNALCEVNARECGTLIQVLTLTECWPALNTDEVEDDDHFHPDGWTGSRASDRSGFCDALSGNREGGRNAVRDVDVGGALPCVGGYLGRRFRNRTSLTCLGPAPLHRAACRCGAELAEKRRGTARGLSLACQSFPAFPLAPPRPHR